MRKEDMKERTEKPLSQCSRKNSTKESLTKELNGKNL
jgi:hypothetical protein